MDLELRHLRCLVAIVDSGSFTDAAIELGISQAAVSRNLGALEHVLGVRLLHRTSRSITLTTAGVTTLAQARQVLAAVGNLIAEATTGHTRLRIGHAWAAMGRAHPRVPAPLGRQVPGRRAGADPHQLAHRRAGRGPVRRRGAAHSRGPQALRQRGRGPGTAVLRPRGRRPVGQQALDQPQRDPAAHPAGRLAHRDHHPDLWPADAQPVFQDTRDIDDWLAIIAAGGGVGITPESTTTQYRRDGVVFRPLRNAPLVTVQMIWRRHDPHPSTHAAVALLADLYRGS